MEKRQERDVVLRRLIDESGSQRRARQKLLAEIAKILGPPPPVVVSYFVHYQYGMLDTSDVLMLEDVLQASKCEHSLYLILDGPGGLGLAAEQIVNVCRTYGSGSFSVIVPKMAKSAATVVCLGAQKIVLGPTAELGPIDPQIRLEGGFPISATAYVERYKKLLNKAETTKGNLEPFLMSLKAFDPVIVEELEREIELSKKIAHDVIFSGMWKGKKHTRQLTNRLNIFTDISQKGSHGRAILFPDLKRLGFECEQITTDMKLWELLWELYNRTRIALSRNNAKIIETVRFSFFGPPVRRNYEAKTNK